MQKQIVIAPRAPHTHSLIYLHGLAEQLQNTMPLLTQLSLQHPSLKIVLPQAPHRYNTVLKAESNSWYDIQERSEKSFEHPPSEHFDLEQLKESCCSVREVVRREAEALGSKRVGLVGFSQGCAVAMHAAIGIQLGFVAGVAGFVMLDFEAQKLTVPRCLIYGAKDKVRPFETVQKVWAWLKKDELMMVKKVGHDIRKLFPAVQQYLKASKFIMPQLNIQMRRRFVGGNWKSNNTLAESKAIIQSLSKLAPKHTDVVVAPIALHLPAVQAACPPHVQVALQNCSAKGFGAFTGQLSPLHAKDMNIPWIIIGHSERRTLYKEDDDLTALKVQASLKEGVKVIACFGQTLEEREAGHTFEVIGRQLAAITKAVNKRWEEVVLAYEPVWAIGTGKTATPAQVEEVHKWIRQFLTKQCEKSSVTRVIYGGSVNEKNCCQLAQVANVDGFLVGGASLKPAFLDIVAACEH